MHQLFPPPPYFLSPGIVRPELEKNKKRGGKTWGASRLFRKKILYRGKGALSAFHAVPPSFTLLLFGCTDMWGAKRCLAVLANYRPAVVCACSFVIDRLENNSIGSPERVKEGAIRANSMPPTSVSRMASALVVGR